MQEVAGSSACCFDSAAGLSATSWGCHLSLGRSVLQTQSCTITHWSQTLPVHPTEAWGRQPALASKPLTAVICAPCHPASVLPSTKRLACCLGACLQCGFILLCAGLVVVLLLALHLFCFALLFMCDFGREILQLLALDTCQRLPGLLHSGHRVRPAGAQQSHQVGVAALAQSPRHC